MTLVIENGTGVTNAVAYVQATAATTLLTARNLVTAAWTALGTSGQEQAIVRGADLLNDQRRHPWKGTITVQGQAMMWPRTGIAFPLVLPLCNALYAVAIANGIQFDAASSSLGSITQVALPGGLSVTFDPAGSAPESDPTASPLVRLSMVDGLLFPYILLPRDAVIGAAGGVVFVPQTRTVHTVNGDITTTVPPEYCV